MHMVRTKTKPRSRKAEADVAKDTAVAAPPVVPEPVEAAPTTTETAAAAVVEALALGAKEVKVPTPTKAPEAKTDKPVKQSSTYILKQMVYAAPDATVDQLIAQLAKLGLTITKSTAQTVRSDFLHSLKALAQLGAVEWPKKK